MNSLLPWMSPAIAVGTMLGMAAVAYSAVSRLEKTVGEHTKDIQDLIVRVAVIDSKLEGD